MSPGASALSGDDIQAVQGGYAHFDPKAGACTSDNSSETVPTGRFLPTGPGTTFDGHTLPAGTGGTGNEEEAVLVNGHAELAPPSKDAGNHLALAPKGMTPNDVKYYINMRWRYAVWNWRGDGNTGAEDVSWYTQQVRKVLVTNPKTGRGVITSIIESGPAPWTGTQYSANNPPSYWQGYIDGTPPQYKGRVSGLAPAAFLALDNTTDMAKAEADLQRRPDNLDNDLAYQWAPDQSLPAGTVVQGNQVIGGSILACESSAANGQFVFYSQYDPKWKNDCYGGGTAGNCTYSTIGQGGCGPSSLAEVVATFKDHSVTPKTTADYSTSQHWYIPGNGSSWDLFRFGPAHWGLKSQEIGTNLDAAVSAIHGGALVIASGEGASPYTSSGHIIVLRGVTADGKILLGDPNVPIPADKARNNTQGWDPATIKQGLKNLWIITNAN
jgi:hypothetical protein